MKELLVSIDPAGRIVLPKKVREDLAIKAGDVFRVSVQGAAVTLTPEKETAGFIRKGKALVFATPGSATLEHGGGEHASRGLPPGGRGRSLYAGSGTSAPPMKVLLDTSVLVAAVLEMHEAHGRAFTALDRVQQGRDQGVVSAHSLAEVYAILTRVPAAASPLAGAGPPQHQREHT